MFYHAETTVQYCYTVTLFQYGPIVLNKAGWDPYAHTFPVYDFHRNGDLFFEDGLIKIFMRIGDAQLI